MKSLKKCVFPLLGVIVVSAFPVIFLYCQSADQAGFIEITPMLMIVLGASFVLFAIFFLIMRSASKAAILSMLFIFVGQDFALIEPVFKLVLPGLKYWHTVSLMLFLLLHIAWIFHRFVKEQLAKDIMTAASVAFGMLIVFNLITSAPKIINRIKAEDSAKETQTAAEFMDSAGGLPNFYLLIFDEYANFPQMEEYYNYDNKKLKDFFKENGFTVSLTSHNESKLSETVQTNMMNLDYIVQTDYPSNAEKAVLRKNGVLFDIMRENGYKVNILEVGDFYNGHMPTNKKYSSGAKTINGETLMDIISQRSILYPFFIKNPIEHLTPINELAAYMSAPENLPEESTFTLVYFCFPHQPFVVDENGDPVEYSEYQNWEDRQYYLGQYKYCTDLMIEILQNIVTNDPSSIISIQSDHGARGNRTDFFPPDAMSNCLNALYYPGEEPEFEGLSSVNTLRYILNMLIKTHFEMLDVPEWNS